MVSKSYWSQTQSWGGINYYHTDLWAVSFYKFVLTKRHFPPVSRKFDKRFFFNNNEKLLFSEICSIITVSVSINHVETKERFF